MQSLRGGTDPMSKTTNKDNGTLWASVFVICLAIIISASRHTPAAVAEGVISQDGFTLTTASTGQGADYLYLIDNRTSMLLVYDTPIPQNRQFIRPVATWSLPALFNSVRN